MKYGVLELHSTSVNNMNSVNGVKKMPSSIPLLFFIFIPVTNPTTPECYWLLWTTITTMKDSH